MDNLIYIEYLDLFINLDQVISAKFVPEHVFEDSDSYAENDPRRMVQVPDRITLTTTGLELHKLYGYEGELESFTNQSKDLLIEGSAARNLALYLTSKCNQLIRA